MGSGGTSRRSVDGLELLSDRFCPGRRPAGPRRCRCRTCGPKGTSTKAPGSAAMSAGSQIVVGLVERDGQQHGHALARSPACRIEQAFIEHRRAGLPNVFVPRRLEPDRLSRSIDAHSLVPNQGANKGDRRSSRQRQGPWRQPHEVLRRYGRCDGNQGAGGHRPARRRDHQPVAGGQIRARLQGRHRRDLRDRPRPRQRRSCRHRLRGHAARRASARQDRQERRRSRCR